MRCITTATAIVCSLMTLVLTGMLEGCAAPDLDLASYAIVGATLMDGTALPPVDDSVVLVEDGKIAAMGSASDVRIPSAARRVNGRRRFVFPRIIDQPLSVGGPADLILCEVNPARDPDYMKKTAGRMERAAGRSFRTKPPSGTSAPPRLLARPACARLLWLLVGIGGFSGLCVEGDHGIGAVLAVIAKLGLVLDQQATFAHSHLRIKRQQKLLARNVLVAVIQRVLRLLNRERTRNTLRDQRETHHHGYFPINENAARVGPAVNLRAIVIIDRPLRTRASDVVVVDKADSAVQLGPAFERKFGGGLGLEHLFEHGSEFAAEIAPPSFW